MLKNYTGSIPACGVYCGGCPNFVREKDSCSGAGFTDKCVSCSSYHGCCTEQNITRCFECSVFPCVKFKTFRKRWLKYGQDFVENQLYLKEFGTEAFSKKWNEKADKYRKEHNYE